jgi:hypothetical protein
LCGKDTNEDSLSFRRAELEAPVLPGIGMPEWMRLISDHRFQLMPSVRWRSSYAEKSYLQSHAWTGIATVGFS